MEDNFYLKLRSRAERHLSKSPKLAIVNALLFTLITVLMGIRGLFSYYPSAVDGVSYWIIFIWSLVVAVHSGYLYLNSGAWSRKREKVIEDEVLDAGETYDLDQDEMLAFHLQLRDDIQKRSQTFFRLMLHAAGNIVLWPGVLIVMMILLRSGMVPGYYFTSVFRSAIFLSIFGTLLLGFILPIRQLWQSQPDDERNLRAVYGYRRKRKGLLTDDRTARLAEHDDPDERVLTDEAAKLNHHI